MFTEDKDIKRLGTTIRRYNDMDNHISTADLEFAIPRLELLAQACHSCGERFLFAGQEFNRVAERFQGYVEARKGGERK